jgi:hypothetical protein
VSPNACQPAKHEKILYYQSVMYDTVIMTSTELTSTAITSVSSSRLSVVSHLRLIRSSRRAATCSSGGWDCFVQPGDKGMDRLFDLLRNFRVVRSLDLNELVGQPTTGQLKELARRKQEA